MIDQKTKLIIANALNSEAGFKFAEFILRKLGAFERGFAENERLDLNNRIRREQALWLMDLIAVAVPEKYLEIHKNYAMEKGEVNNGK
jgi:hypothetical protein